MVSKSLLQRLQQRLLRHVPRHEVPLELPQLPTIHRIVLPQHTQLPIVLLLRTQHLEVLLLRTQHLRVLLLRLTRPRPLLETHLRVLLLRLVRLTQRLYIAMVQVNCVTKHVTVTTLGIHLLDTTIQAAYHTQERKLLTTEACIGTTAHQTATQGHTQVVALLASGVGHFG